MLTKSYFFISTIIFSLSLFAEPMNRSNQYLSAKKIVNNLCVACHAVDGNSAISMNPKLAGQHSAYITKQLMNFKSGTRENAVMAGMVASLNDEDMKNLGLYFSQQSLTLSSAKSNGKGSLGGENLPWWAFGQRCPQHAPAVMDRPDMVFQMFILGSTHNTPITLWGN